MKKIISILLSVVLIFSTLTFVSIPAGAETDGYLTYEVSNGEATIAGCDSSISGDITIPSTLGDYPVTSIGDRAFMYCSSLTSITIPESVTTIGDRAFYSCFNLTSITVDDNNPNYSSIDGVLFNKNKTELIQYPIGKTTSSYTIPDGVTSIGNNAFEDCINLTSITIPYGVTSIGDMAFLLCLNLENITIPDSVTHMGHTMFNSCQKLKSVRFPNELTSISRTMFSDCTSLESVIIGKKVTTIEEDAFNHSFESLDIYYKGNEDDWNAIEIGADNYGSLDIATIHYNYTEDSDYSYLTYTVSNGEATITDCDTSVSENITLPKTLGGYPVTKIGDGAFSDCSSLTSVTIGDSVTSIGKSAFRRCSSLTSVTIPNSVTNIGYSAFLVCENLTSITVDVNNSNYSSVDGVLFNKDKTELIQYPIGNTRTSYTIPDSVTSIEHSAFEHCTSLTSVTIPNSVTSIGFYAFLGCENLTSVTIPDSVTSIGYYAFEYCSSLESVTIGDSVTSIGKYVFRGCSSLTSVTIPDSVTSIGDYAFEYCSSLTSVTIGDSVTSIGDDAFYNCTSLTSVTIPNSVTNIGYSAFVCCYSLTSITVNENNQNYSSTDGVLFNKDKTELIQYPIGNTRTSYTIPSTVTSIGSYAFFGCDSLTSVTIPKSLTSIGNYAFYACSSLTSVTIPDSVTSIGNNAFSDCDSLTSITIPNSVTSIGNNAFYRCSSLTSITIPNSVTSIGNNAFYWCSSLTSVTIGDNVTSIGNNAFSGCYSLTSITIPNSVTSIGNYAFEYCYSLTSVTIPDSVTSIGNNAFYRCSSLTSIYILNKDCKINNELSVPRAVTIYGYTGSTAQEYATEYSRIFIALDKAITTEQAASIRLDTEVQGIRFYTQINTEGLDISEIGTLIGPTDLIGEELTLDTEAQGNAVKVVYDMSKGLYENKYVVGSIVGIKEKNYARDFTARAYIVLTNGIVLYSDSTSTRNVADIADAYIADANSGYSELAPDLKSKVDEWAAANDIKPEPTTKHDPYGSDKW